MQSTVPMSCCNSAVSPGVWKARMQLRTSRPCASATTCSSPTRLLPSNAVAGVGVQVPTVTSSPPLISPSGRGGTPSTSYSSRLASPTSPPTNAPLQILVRAATEARVSSAPPAEPEEVSSRLAAAQSWPGLQILALQYQGRLDQQSLVALLRRASQLAAGSRSAPSSTEQYACSSLLESVAMSCALLIPSMGPNTVAAVLGMLGSLAGVGLVSKKQVPPMVVVLVQALILASLSQLHSYSGPQLAFVLRGCAMLSPSGLPEVWLDEWQSVTTSSLLAEMKPEDLDAVVASLQVLYSTQNWLPEDRWLSDMLGVVESKLGSFDGEGLRQLVVALAGLELRPSSGWFGKFRQAFDMRVAAEEVAPHDVAGVLFAFTKLEVTFA